MTRKTSFITISLNPFLTSNTIPMKLLIASLLFALFSTLEAQKIYYTNAKGTTYSSIEYREKKNKQIEKMQSVSKRLKLYETLDTLTHNSDTLLIQFSWFFTDNMKKVKKEEEKKNAYIGTPYPLEESQLLDGSTLSISDLKGKPTLINLWFISCPPCIEEMPALSAMYEKYGEKYNFLAITFEKESKVKEFLQDHHYTLPQLTNNSKLTKKMFKGYPVNIILDKQGNFYKILDSVPYQKGKDGKYHPGNGSEFIEILESLLYVY